MCAVLEHEEDLYPLPIYEPPALYAFVGYGSAVQCIRRISGTPGTELKPCPLTCLFLTEGCAVREMAPNSIHGLT